MNKYLVTIQFDWNDEAMQIIPDHRTYINSLIEDQIIEHYAVSMEIQTIWITLNAESKKEVDELLAVSAFYSYWTYDVHELIIWDGQNYRLPVVQLN
ncbi:MAG TPA: hypothetical protein VHK91_11740 [Flavisolibacter sp.]|jgi:hypothetical protein|nr:hypothetical protein [Flavisolibacter sp.]